MRQTLQVLQEIIDGVLVLTHIHFPDFVGDASEFWTCTTKTNMGHTLEFNMCGSEIMALEVLTDINGGQYNVPHHIDHVVYDALEGVILPIIAQLQGSV